VAHVPTPCLELPAPYLFMPTMHRRQSAKSGAGGHAQRHLAGKSTIQCDFKGGRPRCISSAKYHQRTHTRLHGHTAPGVTGAAGLLSLTGRPDPQLSHPVSRPAANPEVVFRGVGGAARRKNPVRYLGRNLLATYHPMFISATAFPLDRASPLAMSP
jgi:hypothetical protein